ncbi:MAG: hypothetical protein LBT70_00110, partial [Holosporaceae bacterium]|nr:hypothetical protein [Holosporaceae bacterium]
MKKRTVSCVFQSLIAFGLLANGAFVEVNGSNLNGLPYGYNNTQGSNLWGYGNPRGNMGGGMGMGGMNVNPRGNMGGGMGMGGMNVNPNGNMGGGMGEHIQQQPKPYTPPISSSQDQNQKSAFSLFRELHDEELAFKVSAHELAAYIKEELAKIHSSLPSQEKKLLDRLIVYMEYAYSLQKDLEKEDKSHPKAMYTYYMPHDITQHIVDLSIAELFDQTELSTEHLGLFCNALYEMAGNPHGAKRLISLLLLKKTASYDFVPCAVPLKQKILVENMESAGSPAYFQRDVRNPQLNKIAVNFKKYMKHFPIDAYYAKVRYNSDVITPEEDLACTLLHELTHAYHHFFTGIMGVPLDKVFSSQQEKNLFPTHRIGFFNDVSGFIYNSISSSNVNADKYDNYRKLLDSLYKGLHAFSEQQYTMDQYLPLVKKDSYDGRFAALGNRLNLETLHRLAADLIAEQIIAGKNYWRDSEELLTIFGAVPYLEKGKHKVIIIDRDNHVSYLARTRNKMTCFFHSPNPLGRLQERTQPNNGSVSEAKELEVPKIADLLDFLNESLPQHGKVNEIMFINNFTSKLK